MPFSFQAISFKEHQDSYMMFEPDVCALIVKLCREGDVISRNGRSEVAKSGPQVFQKWLAVSK